MKNLAALIFLISCTNTPGAPGDVVLPPGSPDPSSVDGVNQYVSGSRIQARLGTTGDGAKQFLGWFDNQLSVNCTFSDPGDGQTRCLPVAASADAYYSDSSCSQQILVVSSCYATPKYFYIYPTQTPSACPTMPIAYFHIGAQISPAAVFHKSGSTCSSMPIQPLERYYQLGAQAPLTDFAAVSLSVD